MIGTRQNLDVGRARGKRHGFADALRTSSRSKGRCPPIHGCTGVWIVVAGRCGLRFDRPVIRGRICATRARVVSDPRRRTVAASGGWHGASVALILAAGWKIWHQATAARTSALGGLWIVVWGRCDLGRWRGVATRPSWPLSQVWADRRVSRCRGADLGPLAGGVAPGLRGGPVVAPGRRDLDIGGRCSVAWGRPRSIVASGRRDLRQAVRRAPRRG